MDSLSNVLANQCLVFATPGRTKAYPRHLGQTWAFNLEPYQTDVSDYRILSMMTDGVGICLGELQLRSNLPRQKQKLKGLGSTCKSQN